jgi:hypothetical protein
LGLGQIIEGESLNERTAQTLFGKVNLPPNTKPGHLRLLVRPNQPHLVPDPTAIEAEVISFELRPSNTREILRVAVVRVEGKLLRVLLRDQHVAVGDQVRVEIQGECEVLEG